jgi:pectate lyase
MIRERLLPLALVGVGAWFVYGCGGGTGSETGAGGDGAAAGSGGSTGGGSAGSGGTSGTAGAGGGSGSGGSGGSAGAAGRGGAGGAAGRGGVTGTGGAAGRGGTGGGATGGASGLPSCTWPTPASTVMLSATQTISGTYDGGMRRFVGTGPLGGSGQNEDQGALFNVANGGMLQNVILGNPAADGIHCEGTCTLRNVWWEDVGEDAATLQGSSASQVMTIDGGGARGAADKVFQHNGPGTMIIRNLCVQDFGKLYRSCGNCEDQYQRNVQVQNIVAIPGSNTSALVGVNSNYNDTATLSAITIRARTNLFTICQRYTGNNTGAEPTSSGSGPDGTVCKYAASDITWMP